MTPTFQQDFIDFTPQLKSFLYRLLTNRQDVEDMVQDTYLKVFENINSFKGNSSFKTWVFTIALNNAKNKLAKQKRWLENTQDYGANLHDHSMELREKLINVFHTTPDKQYEVKEHLAYCFICINKSLKIEQQICLLLKEIYDFKVREIMEISGLSEGKVKHAIANARKNMIRIFDNRCAFVSKTGACHQCTSLKGVLNPEQDAQAQANQLQMVKEGSHPDKEHLLNLRIELTKGIDILNAPNFRIHDYMLSSAESWVKMGKEKKVLESRPKSVTDLSKG